MQRKLENETRKSKGLQIQLETIMNEMRLLATKVNNETESFKVLSTVEKQLTVGLTAVKAEAKMFKHAVKLLEPERCKQSGQSFTDTEMALVDEKNNSKSYDELISEQNGKKNCVVQLMKLQNSESLKKNKSKSYDELISEQNGKKNCEVQLRKLQNSKSKHSKFKSVQSKRKLDLEVQVNSI